MSLVNFVHRSSKPTNPVAGTFYWVDENAGHKIYFAPDDNAEHLLLLNDEEEIEWIKTRLGELKDEIPTKVSELENDRGYLTVGDLPDVDLGDSDWETIINIVKEETNEIVNDKLTWKII